MTDFKLRLHCKYYWRLLALASASAILLILCITCKPYIHQYSWHQLGSQLHPKLQKAANSPPNEWNTTTTTTVPGSSDLPHGRRILDDDEYPNTRPSPRSYPPPQDNVQTFGVYEHGSDHARASPPSMGFQPQFKHSHSPSAHP